ncbi:MAG: hypothetical protein CVU23_12935, partial [Betaproteobacteria bacterium HGW-Betaproteobacteria-17]
ASINGVTRTGAYVFDADHGLLLQFHGPALRLTDMLANPFATTSSGPRDRVVAPLHGRVLKLMAHEGQDVTEGTPLMIMEAMKMEHTITAPVTGRIAEISAVEGQQVTINAQLIQFEQPEEADQ